MASESHVRRATAEDVDACARLIASYGGGDHVEWQDSFRESLRNPGELVAVAVAGDEVIGYGRVQQLGGNPMLAEPGLPDGFYLAGIVVADTHRRRGVGLALCGMRVAWVADRATAVWFFTNKENAASRALQRKAGFTEVQAFSSPRLNGGWGVLGHRLTQA